MAFASSQQSDRQHQNALSGRTSRSKNVEPFRATADNFARTAIEGDKSKSLAPLLSEKYETYKSPQASETAANKQQQKVTMIKLDQTDVSKIETNARITCKDGAFPKLHSIGNPPQKKPEPAAQKKAMNQTAVNDVKSRTIGHYVVGKSLGQGTFGKVRLGTHTITNESVAIKILEKEKIKDRSDIERVTREINILKKTRHPHVVQLYEIIETSRQLFLIMEYADGGELFDYIVARKRLKEAEACRFFQQLISGVEYIHKSGICHRDLKPENLLLDEHKNIKIVDFGLSNMYNYEEKGLLKTACGSPCYAAPEMIAGKKYAGLKSDIWSCGIILFAMICGHLPFEDPNTNKLYKKILACEYSLPSYLSSGAKDLMKKVLVIDPFRRYSVLAIRNSDWFKNGSSSNNQRDLESHELDGIIVGTDPIPVLPDILSQLTEYTFDSQHLSSNDKSSNGGKKQSDTEQHEIFVKNNKHNQVTSTYYLILKKKERKTGRSYLYELVSARKRQKGSLNGGNLATTSNSILNKTANNFMTVNTGSQLGKHARSSVANGITSPSPGQSTLAASDENSRPSCLEALGLAGPSNGTTTAVPTARIQKTPHLPPAQQTSSNWQTSFLTGNNGKTKNQRKNRFESTPADNGARHRMIDFQNKQQQENLATTPQNVFLRTMYNANVISPIDKSKPETSYKGRKSPESFSNTQNIVNNAFSSNQQQQQAQGVTLQGRVLINQAQRNNQVPKIGSGGGPQQFDAQGLMNATATSGFGAAAHQHHINNAQFKRNRIGLPAQIKTETATPNNHLIMSSTTTASTTAPRVGTTSTNGFTGQNPMIKGGQNSPLYITASAPMPHSTTNSHSEQYQGLTQNIFYRRQQQSSRGVSSLPVATKASYTNHHHNRNNSHGQYKNYRSEPPMATKTMFGKEDNVWGNGSEGSPNAVVMLPPATGNHNAKAQTFKGTNGATARRVSFGHQLYQQQQQQDNNKQGLPAANRFNSTTTASRNGVQGQYFPQQESIDFVQISTTLQANQQRMLAMQAAKAQISTGNRKQGHKQANSLIVTNHTDNRHMQL